MRFELTFGAWRKLKMQFKRLSQVLETLRAHDPEIIIEGIKESNGNNFKIAIDTNKKTFDQNGLSPPDLGSLLMASRILPPENIEEIKKKCENLLEKRKQGIIPVLAIDTNLVLLNFIPKLYSYYSKPTTIFPYLILLSRVTTFEFHYKTSFTYSKDKKDFYDLLISKIENENDLFFKLFNLRDGIYLKQVNRLLSEQGRLGLVGNLRLKWLTRDENYNVLMTKADHVLFSFDARIIANRHVDAIFDSLILYDFDFFAKNTNAEVLFLSSDKMQNLNGNVMNMNTLHVQQPSSMDKILEALDDKSIRILLKIENIKELLLNLLMHAPYLKVYSPDNKISFLLTITWNGISSDDMSNGMIRVLEESSKTIYKVSFH